METTGLLLVVAFLLVILNGMFVAAEFSFVKIRKTQLEILAAAGNKNAKSALFGVANLDAYLSVCQLGITLASLGLGWIGEPAVAHLIRPLLAVFAVDNPALVSSLSIVIGFTIITMMHVVLGELAPKSISIQKAEKAVLILARPMRFMYTICYPLVVVMNGISNALLRVFGMRPASETEQSHSPEELRMMIVDSSKGGKMDEAEGRMLDNIFSFYQKTAKDIMIHRVDTVVINVNDSPSQAVEVAKKSGHTRFPVYDADKDDIIGFLHTKDLLQYKNTNSLAPLLRTPVYAHETMRLDRLLQQMQLQRRQFCVVVDEYGSWQGILTMEDIMESIVGDIQDEFDNEDPEIIRLPDGDWQVSGDLSFEDLTHHIEDLDCSSMDTDKYKILAAHILDGLGRIANVGDHVDLCGKRLIVDSVDKHRITRVRISDIPNPEDEQEDQEE